MCVLCLYTSQREREAIVYRAGAHVGLRVTGETVREGSRVVGENGVYTPRREACRDPSPQMRLQRQAPMHTAVKGSRAVHTHRPYIVG